ncbi:MAG: LysM peptidoglycan-binding domain-containing protein [Chloroflexi bacterium]|nr:LysM peptidoglycan-binding domain-containing protein [Chloroflexota bacterium]
MKNNLYFIIICALLGMLLWGCQSDASTPFLTPLPSLLPPTPVPVTAATLSSQIGMIITRTITVTVPVIISPTPAITFTTDVTVTPTLVSPFCGFIANWVRYTIQPGDTVGVLAQRTGTTITAIQQVNCLADVNDIEAGNPLYLPYLPPTLPPITRDSLNGSPTPTIADIGPGPGTTVPGLPALAVTPEFGLPGTMFTITMTSFPPQTAITLTIALDGVTQANSPIIVTNSQGGAQYLFRSPATPSTGNYVIQVVGYDAAVSFDVYLPEEGE